MKLREYRASFLAFSGSAMLILSGCDKPDGTNAGLTNGPPPGASDKAAVRDDLPASATPPIDTPAGTPGPSAAMPTTPSPDKASATPPTKESSTPGTAAGGTKPAETIKEGTPKSPQ